MFLNKNNIIICIVDMFKKNIRYTPFLLFFIFLMGSISVYSQNRREISLADEYYRNGELDKALSIYSDLSKNVKNIPLIHQNYFKLLINTGRTEEAEKYINKVIKKFPSNINYRIDKGLIYREQNDEEKEKKYYRDLIDEVSGDPFLLQVAAQRMIQHQLLEYALETYKAGRKKSGNDSQYAVQMASLYRLLNKKEDMVNEYLRYVNEHPNNLRTIKNILQNALQPEDLDSFEKLLYDKVQRSPNNIIYNDLLIWVNLQRKNFYGAFIQARALDKRKKLGGVQVMDIGKIALENKDYNNSIKIFEYVIKQYPGTINYQIARRLIIKSREELIKGSYPVNRKEILNLIHDYDKLISDLGVNAVTVEAMRSKALLYAFYLNEHEKAIQQLQELLKIKGIKQSMRDQIKLDLGDIYLLTGQPWESTLLYSQIEKTSKETPIGYEAKLRNAKLSYYKGDFALAQDRLDILKMATSREIANDAMALSLLIQENTGKDSDDTAMKKFADIDLLIFQNKKQEALDSLHALLGEYPGHSLTDEILWRSANLNLQTGAFIEAVADLREIVDKYGDDILGDDAMFLLGKIYEEQIQDKEKAMEVFREFLKKYPGSIYAAEARKRFRRLRGDAVQ